MTTTVAVLIRVFLALAACRALFVFMLKTMSSTRHIHPLCCTATNRWERNGYQPQKSDENR
jgi:hypothetical protein